MNIEKIFEPYNCSSIIFDPIPSYSGDWVFSVENLLRNSKKENGINLFQKFLEETYYKPLKKIFKSERILKIPIEIYSTPNENNMGRCLKYLKIEFFLELRNFLNQKFDSYGKKIEDHYAYLNKLISHIEEDNETLNLAFVEALKAKEKRLKDLLDNEVNSEYFYAAMEDYDFEKKFNPGLQFTQYIKALYEMTIDYKNGLMNLGDFFDQKLDYNEIYKAFDPDTFYLLFAKIIYEFNLEREKETGKLDNNYGYLNFYNYAVGEVSKEEKKYDPKIKFTLSSGKRLRYSRYQFQQQFKELMDKHPEAKTVTLPNLDEVNKEKYKDIDLMQKLSKLYEEETKVNWEFLPAGVGIKKGPHGVEKKEYKTTKKDKEELINETNMRINILENSGFIGRPVKGLNTFTGYYAFIYPSGKVILEKFWENEETLNPADGCATYIMDIDNFIEMSKMSRLNLIEYMKTIPEVGIKRIFHTSINNWQRNLYNEINGTYRLDDAINFINGLRSEAMTHE